MKHEVKVIEVDAVLPHPNADTLGITVIDGYDVIVRTAEWRAGDRGVYIEPDYVVPDAPWAAMLAGRRRVRVKKLRGVYSQGLLLRLADVGLDADTPVGTDVMATLGIMRWEPPQESMGAADAPTPGCITPRVRKPASVDPDEVSAPPVASAAQAYDLESWRKYRRVLEADESVIVTEKIHGENARFVFDGETMHAGSRTKWKRLDSNTSWAVALRCNPWIEAWCRENPRRVLYGEVFGNVAKMAYGVRNGMRGFLAFDVLHVEEGRWLSWDEFAAIVPAHQRVPVLYEGPHGVVTAELAEGASTLAPHVREGFVVKPRVERSERRVGRVALKCVGNGYYEKGD